MRGLQLVDCGLDRVGDLDVARALGAGDAEGDHRLRRRARAKVRGSAQASVTVPSSSTPHLAAARQRDRRGGSRSASVLAPAERADRLLAAADLAAAAGEIDVGGAQLPVDVAGGDAERVQPVGIERDADLAVDAAERSTRATPFTPCSSRTTMSSTNQDSSSGVMAGADAA